MTVSTLVTCHANADFDALASMLAARRLYAPCVLLFPGTQEARLQKLMEDIEAKRFDFVDAENVDWGQIKNLVVVDTRQRGRLNHIENLLERQDLHVEVWDHHPGTSDDIASNVAHIEYCGSATSLLVTELRKFAITITKQEATLLGLGIYGDTGSFTYASTTVTDFEAAAWLLRQGMDVNQITTMTTHELTAMQVSVLNDLLESAREYQINRRHIAIAEVSLENYMGDFAFLTHRLMEMRNYRVLFTLGRMADRIQVVARSRVEDINVGDVCAYLGGGGHTYAASASVRFLTLSDIRDRILNHLQMQSYGEATIRAYMTTPVIAITTATQINEADEMMLHFGLKSVPVFQPGTHICVGILDSQTATKARVHGLGEALATDYMQRRFQTLTPEARLNDLTEVIVDQHQRLVPIVEQGEVIGVMTRTDLVNLFSRDSTDQSAEQIERHRDISRQMRERLPAESRTLLNLAGETGRELNLPVYAVGGFVRDLLLNTPNHDIDLVTEGNGLALAQALAKKLHGRVSEHKKFLTSVVIFNDEHGQEQHLDVATARLEYYEHPAALPTVESSSIKMDLYRRDFTINALAIRLDSPTYDLVDFFGGQKDIKDKVIRVIHTLSFVEDPTRCLRAVRFEQRNDFHIGQNTEKLIKNAVSLTLLDKLSDQRLFNEFQRICMENNPPACFFRLESLGILKAVFSRTLLSPEKKLLLQKIRKFINWYNMLYFEEKIHPWMLYFLGLSSELNHVEVRAMMERFHMVDNLQRDILRHKEKIRFLKRKLQLWYEQNHSLKNECISLLYQTLRTVTMDSLLYIMAIDKTEGLAKYISRYITQWRKERPDIDGEDLKQLGLAPGQIYGRILTEALYAKLDNKAPDKDSQLELARQIMAQASS